MTNSVVKPERGNKQGPYEYKHEAREGQLLDRPHPSLLGKAKARHSELEGASEFRHYVSKQALLQSRMSSVETDVPSTYYRKLASGRKSGSFDSCDSLDKLDAGLGAAKESLSFYEKPRLSKGASLKGVKEKSVTKSMLQNGMKWELGDRYKFVDMVGSGSYGHVCRAYDSLLNKFVAIKRIHKVFDDLIDCKRILREIAILNRLDHPNIVKILDILIPSNLETFDVLYVVLEIAASDIKQLVRSPAFLNESHIRLLVFNLLSGVHYLHSVGIYHRDLKPANCLINRDCSVKICDFGLARTTTIPEDLTDSGSFGRRLDTVSTNITSRSLPDSFGHSADSFRTNQSESYRANYSEPHRGAAYDPYRPAPEAYRHELEHRGAYYDLRADAAFKHADHRLSDRSGASFEAHSAAAAAAAAAGHSAAGQHSGKPQQVRRQLTGHVVTRWYRAPELILLQENYSFAVDIWSVGCIFAELLNMMKVNVSEPADRSPLFPGSSCFPLSPDNKGSGGRASRETDQLNLIFNVLGTPSEEDIESIEKPDVRRYVKFFAKRGFQDLRTRFKGSSLESLDLLKRMLTFNPDKRISVWEALNHPYFKSISRPRPNFSGVPKVTLPFNDSVNMSESQLRYSFLREIQRYHKDFKIPVKIIYRS